MENSILSRLAKTLIPSEIVKLGGAIKAKIQSGKQIYNYTIGDFDSSIFPIPQVLQEYIVEAYRQRKTTYPAANGELVLRNAVSAFISRYHHVDYSPAEILIASGGRPLIYTIYRTIVDKGDRVIYMVPSWNNNHYVHFTEGEHVTIEALPENQFMPKAEQIKPHIKGAALLALCSPLNPTGTTFHKKELEAICDLVLEENASRGPDEKKLFVMFDQIYWTLTYGETRHYNPIALRPEMKPYTVFVDGISKAFAATGVRVGWALGPEEIIAKMSGINSHIGSWAPMAEQHATAKFLNNHDAVDQYLHHFKSEILYRLEKIYEGFHKLKELGFDVDAIKPQAAIYLTVQVNLKGKRTADGKLLEKQEDVTSYLLNEASLAMVPFGSFGSDKESNWYRLSVGCCKKEDINMVMSRLKSALEKLS